MFVCSLAKADGDMSFEEFIHAMIMSDNTKNVELLKVARSACVFFILSPRFLIAFIHIKLHFTLTLQWYEDTLPPSCR